MSDALEALICLGAVAVAQIGAWQLAAWLDTPMPTLTEGARTGSVTQSRTGVTGQSRAYTAHAQPVYAPVSPLGETAGQRLGEQSRLRDPLDTLTHADPTHGPTGNRRSEAVTGAVTGVTAQAVTDSPPSIRGEP